MNHKRKRSKQRRAGCLRCKPNNLEKVNRGLERAATEGVISHADAKARLGKWLVA